MDEIDPFEARLLFSNMLDNLTGAQPTIDRVSAFAIKNHKLADDLFECIQEKLERFPIPPRLNVLLVLDGILASSSRSTSTQLALQAWKPLISKDLSSLVHKIAPEASAGNSNVLQAHKIVSNWQRKKLFDKAELDKLSRMLAKRVGDVSGSHSISASESGMRHQDILKRIEEDRERHKRHKEDAWIRPANESPKDELCAYWETVSDFNDADWQEISADNETYQLERSY
ncbi:hypothetical protein LPJ78_001778 [Coemansia sp. RSA 989]|nr:CTD kinase subunit gamma CTK3-domain-containing protein [Coemansia mojavensis]KAJ1742848.1 hypothetical protein LPJ68_001550 [Coemansia sp. RSA 1086]KAJ1751473.1 hypothetical protein LPJ79_002051 [Coemansia sp. RSA 1821]KAJ1866517.1 hypothetical protein LPJ78_001778 [Coemansia sp. RSA 989]KAJ1873835.1 hypothetical protein LPJ55_001969 [Coemansia sp. RSA 990]KAJ2620058.1 hypothetical protein H4R22_005338 [Coemansia sp. RSA 1290]KAJ2648356.1 hypothetical protein IWW40_003994 [Coemansia sp. R